MKNAVAQYDQLVFIDGVKLKGVSAVDGSYTNKFKPLNVLGQGVVKTIVADVPEGDFSITRNLEFKDVFNPFTGIVQNIRGSINYGNKIFGFETGYMSSYSYSVNYGDLPQSNVAIKVYGDIGSGLYITDYNSNSSRVGDPGTLNATGKYFDEQNLPVYPGNIILNCRNSSTNRIKAFSFSTNINYDVIYGVNSIIPLQVSIKYPVEVLTSFTVEVDDYETKRMTDALLTGANEQFSIDVYGTNYEDIPLYGIIIDSNEPTQTTLTAGDGTPLLLQKKSVNGNDIKLFNFDSSSQTTKLVSEQISSSADDLMSVKLNYVTYVNKVNNNSNLFREISDSDINYQQSLYQQYIATKGKGVSGPSGPRGANT